MKQIVINTYSFSELSDEAKERAIKNLYDINVDYSWWEFTYDDAANIGLKITGFDLDRNKHCTGELLFSANEVCQNIFNNHGESCETYQIAQLFMNKWQPLFSEYMDENSENYESLDLSSEMQELEDEFLSDLLEEYASILQKRYDYLTSEDAIIEAIDANDYHFYSNGELA